MTLRSLRIFEAVASARSFSRGSELLGITQSAASQQVHMLEQEVGARLFDTAARPIQLTPAGRALLDQARRILAQINVASDALASLEGQFRGQLHVGVVSPAHYFVPKLISAFLARYTEARIKLSIGKPDSLLQMLDAHEIDLMIGGPVPPGPRLEAKSFSGNPHCMVGSANHRLAGRTALTWKEIQRETFIFREPGSSTRNLMEHILEAEGIEFEANLELEGNETVKQAVTAGLGISLLSAHVFQQELEAGRLAVLKLEGMPKWQDWCLLSRREQTVPAIRQAFRDFVVAEGRVHTACMLAAPQRKPRQSAATS